MTQDEIIRMAQEALIPKDEAVLEFGFSTAELERFAALVRADEQMKALESARTIGGDWAVLFEREYLK